MEQSDGSPPTLEEVAIAIAQLNNTTPGNCRISAPLLRYGGTAAAEWIHRVILAAWATGKAPQDWKWVMLTYLYKGKGPRLLCDSHRGISLLSVCGKVYTNILIRRLRRTIDPTLHEAQCGFRPGRGCPDHLFTLRRVCELAHAHRTPLFAAFVDYKKAFDCLDREALWQLLAARGVHTHLIALIRDLYAGCEGEVHIQGARSRRVRMRTGVRQGCALSPMLFNVYIDHILRTALSTPDMQAHGYPIASDANGILSPPTPPRARPNATPHRICFLLYADDLVLLSPTREGLTALLRRLEEVSSAWAMTINYSKTEAIHFHPSSTHRPPPGPTPTPPSPPPQSTLPPPIRLRLGTVKFVHQFVYLGSTFTADGALHTELRRRIGLARRTFTQLGKLWKQHRLGVGVKMLVFKAIVPPTLLYGCETWALTAQQTQQLDVFLHECLRTVLGIRRGLHVANSELRLRCRQLDFSTLVRKHRLRFLGHIARRPAERLTKVALFASHIPGVNARMRQGGCYLTELFREDLLAVGAFRDWYHSAQNRVAWRAMLEDKLSLNSVS